MKFSATPAPLRETRMLNASADRFHGDANIDNNCQMKSELLHIILLIKYIYCQYNTPAVASGTIDIFGVHTFK